MIREKIGKYRHRILALVFFATTINYLDRQVISLLKDDYLQPLFKITETDYANIVIIFQLTYAIGMLGAGWFIDKIGTRLGYAISLAAWSLSAIGHSFARNVFGFSIARGALGISEAGNFPAAVKTVAEWFPKKDRALATGIFNSGANIGAIVAPLAVPLIAIYFGWQWAFILTGIIGLIWLFFWLITYEIPLKNRKLSKEEFEYIHGDKEEETEAALPKIKWIKLFTYRQTWAFFFGKLLTDPIWFFYLFWLPSFLNKQYGMTKTQLALPIAVVYTLTTIGSIFGGWLSGFFIKKGMKVHRARATAMLIFALCVVPIITVQYFGSISPWLAVMIVGLATAAHQAWSANIFTTVSDMFPKNVIASVVGVGIMAGSLGTIAIARTTGLLLDHYKALGHIQTGYKIMFAICSSAYIIAWIVFNILAPKMKKI